MGSVIDAINTYYSNKSLKETYAGMAQMLIQKGEGDSDECALYLASADRFDTIQESTKQYILREFEEEL
jgi:hypothetical protein